MRLRQSDLGFEPDKLAYGSLRTSDTSAAGQSAFLSRASSSIDDIPEITSTALIGYPVFDGSVVPDGRDAPLTGDAVPLQRSIDWDFFDVLGIRINAGRAFGPADEYGSQPVAIVNQLAAERYWPRGDAVGRTIRLRSDASKDELLTVVGVVADTRLFDPLAPPEPILYRPIGQAPSGDLGVFVRTANARPAALAQLRATIARLTVGPTWSDGVYWLPDHFSRSLSRQRFVTRALLSFALLGIGLAALGVYGVAAQAAALRTREVGIRIALGARRRALLVAALRETAAIAAVGVGIGLAGSWASTRLIQSVLAGAAPANAQILLAAAIVLAAVVMLAGYVPANRLTRVDPVIALRAE
jgi:hypothetical protein